MLSLLFSVLLFLPYLVFSTSIGNFKDIQIVNNNQYLIVSDNNSKLKITWLEDQILRIQAVLSNSQFEELKTKITVTDIFETPAIIYTNTAKEIILTNKNINAQLKINKTPLKFQLISNDIILFNENNPINIDTSSTIQSFIYDKDEHFFGGGMQNGRFNHKDSNINITVSYNWNDGGNPNPVPFMMSSKGYGIFRNTFSPGNYNFKNQIQLIHNENKLDSYYFIGNYKQILNKYTYLTGRPFMPPIYGLELGDADCYSKTANGRPPKDTLIDSTKVADGYIENDLPIGWMLVNDGYGCGYTQLNETNQSLNKRNITLGLWTESNLNNQPNEVGKWGVRVRKLDVKWVGRGYEFGFKACNEAYNGIQDYSTARGFVWQVEGWAGVQKCSVQWTGDQYGTWENIRFHIPTIHGSGLSSQVYTAGDIDGIFEGSPNTFIRDLQFKVFTPVFMSISGWASKDKQPWRFGEPGTSINRKYLKLREQLLPYIYTLAYEAYQTGIPIVRSMLLEYPDDKSTYDKELMKYQYMFGNSFLVAPVYKNELKRDNIYLPQGKWIDYWNNKIYTGPITLNNYNAPLDILPLFVKENSIIPMWNSINSYKQRKLNDLIILDIYPSNFINNNNNDTVEYKLYEDDLVTRQFKNNQFTLQKYEMTVTSSSIKLKINAVTGDYNGKSTSRKYQLLIHNQSIPPKSILFSDNNPLHQFNYSNNKYPLLTILLDTIDTNNEINIIINY